MSDEPEAIIKEMKARYLTLESYSDSGTVKNIPPVGKASTEFKTYFERPSRVRFEWRSWHPHFGKRLEPDDNVVFSDGSSHRCYFLGEDSDAESLEMILSAAFGVSSASSLAILKLLVPDCITVKNYWANMTDLEMDDSDQLQFPCYHIKGSPSRGGLNEVWIKKDDLTVRRVLWALTWIPLFSSIEFNYSEVCLNPKLDERLFVKR